MNLGITLKLSPAALHNVDHDYRLCREKAREMLYTWMEMEGNAATVGILADALEKIRKKSIAQKAAWCPSRLYVTKYKAMNNKTPDRGPMRTDYNGMTTVAMATQEEYTMTTLRLTPDQTPISKYFQWTTDHDVIMCREVLVSEPYKFKQRTPERGKAWESVAQQLNSIHHPNFRVTSRSVCDRQNMHKN
ncbi:hypothetical protein OS493_011385 [Desmophyllum pertusum]|uniref:Death domain-containing protein n=1 Tax=Desmophyllum pertusum TaxID=174260 RepID=A0A9X0CLK8_9CNID|nr:hypothetical protein OS493_011385 [Desmophyllum pertusum]